MINSAVVSAWLWVHIGLMLVVVAYSACGYAVLPAATERGRRHLARRPVRTLGLGLLVSVPWMVGAIVLMNTKIGPIAFIGVVMAVVWALLALLGLASVALLVGDRGELGPVRWTTVARGAALVGLTWILPIVGWFVALPLSLCCGLGCLLASLSREEASASPVA